MTLPKLACSGKLGNCKPLRRFHWTCIKCRWRWEHYKGWKPPPYFIDYMPVWSIPKHIYIDYRTGRVYAVHRPFAFKIDPRGRLVALRCAIIVTLMKLAGRMPKSLPQWDSRNGVLVRKRFVSLAEMFACITF